MVEDPVFVSIPGGPKLEARLGHPPGAPSGGLVLCHPHPLYGGDMDNPVVRRAAEAAAGAGLITLRFNFRGVGASEGSHGGGDGEQDDVAAALGLLAERLPGARPLGLLGYSFGAWVAARVAAGRTGLAGLCLIAPPVGMLAFPSIDAAGLDTLLVAGTRDDYCPPEELRALAAQGVPGETVSLRGADHLFSGQLVPLAQAVAAWAARWARP
jgi:alpha/beta superfamily hydrolase